MTPELSFLDLVSLADIQGLIDFTRKAASIPAGLVDEFGTILAASEGWPSWTQTTRPDQALAAWTHRPTAVQEIRGVAGLRQVWLPFCVNHKVIAWMILGDFGIVEETLVSADVKELSQLSGLSLDVCRARMKDIQRISRMELDELVEMLGWQVHFICTLATHTLVMRRQLVEHNQAQAALSEMEKRYQDIFDSVLDGIMVESPDGTILDANQEACRMHGYTHEEMLQLQVQDLVAPGRAVAYITPESQNDPSPIRSVNRRKDGSTFAVELNGRIWEAEGKLLTLVVLRDISQREQQEAASRLARERLELALEATDAGLWDWDVATRQNFVTPRWYVMLGYAEGEIANPNDNWHALVHPDDYLRVSTLFDRYLNGQRSSYDTEFRMRCKDGSWHWVQSRGKIVLRGPDEAPLRVIGLHIDISTRKSAEVALRVSEEKFFKSFQTSPDAISINRGSDLCYLDINDGFTRLSGYTRAEIIGKSVGEINLWVDPQEHSQMLAKLADQHEVLGMELAFRRKDGTIGTGLIAARSLDLDGEACFMGIIRDISDRKQAEGLLQDAHLRLEWAYEATLLGWNRALEMKDIATRRHSDRCVDQTVDLARAAGILDETDLRMIKYGAILHDVGKLAIPDKILNKPNPLSPEEWVIMRRHPLFAHEMLLGIEYLESVLPLVTNHHERWDGSGYPFGLKGDEIPLSARIFAIVDVFDSITHERPWRATLTQAEAVEYIRTNSGLHFDPRLVKLFLEMIANEKG